MLTVEVWGGLCVGMRLGGLNIGSLYPVPPSIVLVEMCPSGCDIFLPSTTRFVAMSLTAAPDAWTKSLGTWAWPEVWGAGVLPKILAI